MRWNRTAFRLCASVAAAALLGTSSRPAAAQPAPPLPSLPGPASDPAPQNQPDPPARVGRVAAIRGTTSFHAQDDTQWSPAAINFPVSTGNAFWTEPAARMTLEVSGSRITMAGGTELDIASLDPMGLQAVAARGEIYLHLRDLAPDEAWSITTPRGAVHLNRPGRYGITAGTTDDPTLVTVLEGAATVEAPGVALQVGPGQTATLTGREVFQGAVGPAPPPDAFLTEATEAERPPSPPPQLPPPVAQAVSALPGGVDIVGTGSWAEAPEYGQVWYPPVSPGWVPYRQGHWAWVAPWGWTWIDDAPWGFAPFHYGRWIEIGNRWAWTPGELRSPAYHPVYAPALVAFVGLAAGAAIGAALASRPVGWVPLGPREPFRPWYHASPHYVQQVNVTHVTNITNNVTVNNFINRNAATTVPASAMVGSRPIAPIARPIPPQQFTAARPIVGQPPVAPTASTLGVTPAAARALNVPTAGARPAAPGPAIRPFAPGPAIRPFAPGPAINRLPGGPISAGPAAARPAGIGMPGAGGVPGTVVTGPRVPGSTMPNVVEPHAGPGNRVQAPPMRSGLPGSVQTEPGAGFGHAAPQPLAPGAVVAPGVMGQHIGPRPQIQGVPPNAVPQVSTQAPAQVPHVQTPYMAGPASPPPQHVQGQPPAAPPPHVQALPPDHHFAPPQAIAPQHFAAPAAMAPPHFSAPPPAPAPHFAPPAPAPHVQAPPPPHETHSGGHPRRPGEP